MKHDIELVLHRQELAATVEALYESLIRRIKWTVMRDERRTVDGWAALEFETAQSSIDQVAGALARLLMVVGEQENVHAEFQAMFTPIPEVWDLVTQVTLASSWAEAPTHESHPEHRCEVCLALAEA